MKLVVQRCLESSVTVQNEIVGKIPFGVVVLVAFTEGDSKNDIDYLADKLVHLRIFDDECGVMNRSLIDVQGSVLSISQFTLYGSTKKGRRPSYASALNGKLALPLYQLWNQTLKKYGVSVETGQFGADMLVNIQNDGPVTLILESRSGNDKE